MNRLVWKLLRKDFNVPQLLGFFLANLLGMIIILLSLQFYADILPVFTQGDSFMKKTYIVVGKRVTATQTLLGTAPDFSQREIADLQSQPFVEGVGEFVPALFDVYASLGSENLGIGLSTEMFLESIPDEYIDADLSRWLYRPGSDSIPVVLPRNYLNLYNFGYASTKGLPVLSETLIGNINIRFHLRGTNGQRVVMGRVVAFSNRLNTILVPSNFMEETNALLSPERTPKVSRLILEVKNPADERLAQYLSDHRYEEEGNAADTGKMAYFLRMIVAIVLVVGVVICLLSFYVLLLSIYLLLQKHTEKIDHLLLMGYTPRQVATPFYLLSGGMNLLILLLSLGCLHFMRNDYLQWIGNVYPQLEPASVATALGVGVVLCFAVSGMNFYLIRSKVIKIWYLHRR